MQEQSLAGRVIAVPETRELDVFAAMLERRGATALRCPLVTILDAPDPAPVLAWLRDFCAGSCDDLILITGEGLRRLLSCIEQHEPALREPFPARLQQVRRITRGPKPARVLRELGLKPDLAAATPTTAGVIETLRSVSLSGRRVGVQLYGTEPNRPLVEFLEGAGASVLTVAPYVYADSVQDESVRRLIERMAAGEVDAIAFTSSAQVERLFAVSTVEQVHAALARTHVAAIGPIVIEALAKHGITAELSPKDSFFMKPLTSTLEEALGPKLSAQ